MERTVVLVDLRWKREKDPTLSLGHASLVASLSQTPGVLVRPVELKVNAAALSRRDWAAHVLESVAEPSDCTDIAIGVYVWNEGYVNELLCEIRKRGFGGRIILGGPQVSFSGSGVEDLFPAADVFVRGYAESALSAVVTCNRPRRIAGVHFRGMPDMCEHASVDFARLPSPWLSSNPRLSGQPFIWWETKRGCPFRCAFCQHFETGRPLSEREFCLERLSREVELFQSMGVAEMKVIDPVFNMPRTHYLDILSLLGTVRSLRRVAVEARFEYVAEEFAELAARCGAELEFGLQTVVSEEEEAICRRNDRKRIARAAEMLHAHGVKFSISLIFGLPRQTPSSFMETIDYARTLRPQEIRAFPLGLYRGSRLEREKERWGYEVSYDGPVPLAVASSSFTREDYQRMAEIAGSLTSQVS